MRLLLCVCVCLLCRVSLRVIACLLLFRACVTHRKHPSVSRTLFSLASRSLSLSRSGTCTSRRLSAAVCHSIPRPRRCMPPSRTATVSTHRLHFTPKLHTHNTPGPNDTSVYCMHENKTKKHPHPNRCYIHALHRSTQLNAHRSTTGIHKCGRKHAQRALLELGLQKHLLRFDHFHLRPSGSSGARGRAKRLCRRAANQCRRRGGRRRRERIRCSERIVGSRARHGWGRRALSARRGSTQPGERQVEARASVRRASAPESGRRSTSCGGSSSSFSHSWVS